MTHNIKGLSNHELLVAFSTTTTEAILQINYDKIDEKNHKSLNTLVHFLNDGGFHQVAQIVDKQQPYIVFESPASALRVREYMSDHSAAIHANIIYKGLQNTEAEILIEKEKPVVKEVHHHTSFKY